MQLRQWASTCCSISMSIRSVGILSRFSLLLSETQMLQLGAAFAFRRSSQIPPSSTSDNLNIGTTVFVFHIIGMGAFLYVLHDFLFKNTTPFSAAQKIYVAFLVFVNELNFSVCYDRSPSFSRWYYCRLCELRSEHREHFWEAVYLFRAVTMYSYRIVVSVQPLMLDGDVLYGILL